MTGENSNQTIKKQTRLVARPAAEFIRWFDVSRPPSGDQFPANLLASGIVRIQQLAETSTVFRKYFFRPLEPGPDIRGPRLGTRLLSAFQDVNKKVGKKSTGENSFSQPRKSRRKGDNNRHPGRRFFESAPGFAQRVRRRGWHSCSESRVPSHFRQTLFTCRRRDGLIAGYGIQIL